MKLQQLFAGQGIDWKRTKLIRHNLTNGIVAGNYAAGLLNVYQSVQSRTRFQGCDTVISFLGTEGTNGVFQGCFRVGNAVPFDKALLPENFVFDLGRFLSIYPAGFFRFRRVHKELFYKC